MNGMEKEIIEVALDDIIPNRFQPRLAFDEKGLNELAESIRQHGIIQPLVLRKVADKFEIIAGERRYKAAYIAGLTKVPAVIIDLNDNESAEVAIVENIQRRDLSPIEEAKSYKKLLDRGYLTQDQLASRMGKTQATVSNKLRLLNLDEKVQDALLNNKISERHARSLLRIENKEEQKELLDEIINNRLNVKDTELLISQRLNKNNDEFVQVSNLSNLSSDINNNDKMSEFPDFIGPQIEENKETESVNNISNTIETPKPDLENFFNQPLSNADPLLTQQLDNVDPLLNQLKESNNDFISNQLTTENNNIENEEIEELNEFMSPIDSDIKIDKKEDKNIELIDENILPFNSLESSDIQIVIDKINKLIDEINSLGYKVKLEEYDFERIYQFVIKVDKN